QAAGDRGRAPPGLAPQPPGAAQPRGVLPQLVAAALDGAPGGRRRRDRARARPARGGLRRAAARFARRWRETVAAWTFDEDLNDLIRQHNEWYPIERRLPIDLRRRDYVLVNGRSFRRPVLDAAWALGEL